MNPTMVLMLSQRAEEERRGEAAGRGLRRFLHATLDGRGAHNGSVRAGSARDVLAADAAAGSLRRLEAGSA